GNPLCCSFGEFTSVNNIFCESNAKADCNKVLPLISCNKSIESHCRRFHINFKDVNSEADLLKYRGGLFDIPTEQCTICPNHRYRLGLGWRSSQLCMLKYCSRGKETQKRKKPLLKGTIALCQSLYLWKQRHQLIQIGSGVCTFCRKEIVKELKDHETKDNKDYECQLNNETCIERDLETNMELHSQFYLADQLDYLMEESQSVEESERYEITNEMYVKNKQKVECSSPGYLAEFDKFVENESVKESETTEITEFSQTDFTDDESQDPVSQLQCNWEEASERTRRNHTNTATSIFQEVLNVIAPGQVSSLSNAVLQRLSSTQSDDNNMLEVLSAAYNQATDWGTQRQILSLFGGNYSLKAIKEFIPDLSKYKYTTARKHSSMIGTGQPVSKTSYSREGLTDEQISHFMDFIMSPSIMTDAPYGETHLKISSGEVFHVPKIILNSVRTRVIEQYESYCKDTHFDATASSRSYLRIMEAVEPNIRKCMKGLDNYAADGAKAFEDLKKVAELLGKLGKGALWQESIQKSLTLGKQYLKIEYKLHISKESETADHCCNFALSDQSKKYTASCQHEHNQVCKKCDDLTETLVKIEKSSDEVLYESADQEDDTIYMVEQSIKAVQEWKKHLLRSYNQDTARSEILHKLSKDEVLVERDWAMKFLPMRYRESQSKWFGKRGLNWHVSVGSYHTSDTDDLKMQTIIHVFDNASQDARTSNAVLRNTLQQFQQMNPSLKKAYIRSDNAGCFHGFLAVSEIALINGEENIKVVQMDFADPQGGKSICDRRAAHIKSAIRKYVNEGHDVCTAADFKKALQICSLRNVAVVVALPPESCNKKEIKSQINNITT
ncbi:Hypothetical predicted protein, partial [Mytilus galloprovincialis]